MPRPAETLPPGEFIYIEPTYENLVIEIGKAMEEPSKNGQIYRSVREIKLFLLLEEE